jgi:hypothetical protein
VWEGRLELSGNRIMRFEPVSFLNPERVVRETEPGVALSWTSVTTGNLAGVDLWLDQPEAGTLSVATNIVSAEVDLRTLGDEPAVCDGGGLGRKVSVYRLPEVNWSTRLDVEHAIRRSGDEADLPVYVRVTQADGHQAWSSPIYLIE